MQDAVALYLTAKHVAGGAVRGAKPACAMTLEGQKSYFLCKFPG